MATFMDMLNQGLGNLTGTPLGQFGTQMLMASGPQQGNPGGGARLGQAVAGMQQMQAQQQQLAQQLQLRQYQQQEMALRNRALQRQDTQTQAISDAMKNDPDSFSGMTPIARQLLSAGASPELITAINKSSGIVTPKQATPPGMFDMPQPDGTYIRNVVNPSTGKLEQSVPFTPPQVQVAQTGTNRLAMDQTYKPQDLAVKQQQADAVTQNAQSTQDRVAVEQQKAQRAADATSMQNRFKRQDFKQAYLGAASQFDDVANLADEIAKSPALPSLYGPNGYIPPIKGSDAANLQAKIDQLTAKGALTELTKLKQQGVSLTPVSDNDTRMASTSAANYSNMQSDTQAKSAFEGMASAMRKAKDEAAQKFNDYDSLFDVKSPSTSTGQSSGQQATIMRTGTDGSGRKVVQYSDGRIEYGN